MAARRRVLGPEHPNTRIAAYNLASTLNKQGQHTEAEDILQSVLAVEQRNKGYNHADTLRTSSMLSLVQDIAQHIFELEKIEAAHAAAHEVKLAEAMPGGEPPACVALRTSVRDASGVEKQAVVTAAVEAASAQAAVQVAASTTQ